MMNQTDEVAVRSKRSRQDDFHPRTNILRQFRALFLKDLTLQWRAWRTNLCQLLTPIIFILFVGLIQVIVNKILLDKNTPVPGTEGPFPPINPARLLSCSYIDNSSHPHHPGNCTKTVLNFYTEFPEWPQLVNYLPKSNITDLAKVLEFFHTVSQEPCQKELFDLPFFYVGASKEIRNSSVFGNTTKGGLVGNMVSPRDYFNFSLDFKPEMNATESCPAKVPENNSIALPLFWEIDTREELSHHLSDVVQEYSRIANLSADARDQYGRTFYVTPMSASQYNSVLGYVKNGSSGLQMMKPQAGVFIDKFPSNPESSPKVDVHYTVVAEELALYRIHINGSKFMKAGGFNLSRIEVDIHRRSAVVNMVDNAILRLLLNRSDEFDSPPYITTYIMPIPPSMKMNLTIDVASIAASIFYPFSASFLIPVFMASIVKDKYEKQLIMMEQNGLSRLTYWLVTYTFNFLLYVPIALEIALFSLMFQIRFFTQTNWLVLTLIFFVWGNSAVVMGFFLSTFFGKPRTAIIVGYLLIIAGVVVALLIEALQVFPNDKNPFPIYMMYPPFAFYRIIEYCINACLTMRCYDLSVLGGLNLITIGLLYLAGTTVVLMVLSVYLSYVLPSTYGVRKSPFFPIIDVYKWLKSCSKKTCRGTSSGKEMERVRLKERSPPPPVTGISMEEEEEEEEDVDVDVRQESDAIREGSRDTAPMVMHQLRKEYPGPGGLPYAAVHGMSLAVERNECFGLLGPNGAGKTTLISVLTGLYEPTSGMAKIAGYDLATEMTAIHHHLGVCPQFDIQHADLTTEEHLLFYARLKGVKWSREKTVVERALRQVNLYDARKKKSKNLSGGMKRRLSVAMACIGNPDILILDEPTTGLDPASRRQVWEVVQQVKEGRSVILTTHAMEEADHLCTRIGIMNFGKLRCLGTQTRLKTRFGTGYHLTFNCAPGQAREVESFMQTSLPYTVHVETYADSCTFKLEKEHLKVSELFPLINGQKTRLGIMDWGIKMTTMEDVFLKIVQQHEDHRTQISRSRLPTWLPCRHCLQQRKGTGQQ